MSTRKREPATAKRYPTDISTGPIGSAKLREPATDAELAKVPQIKPDDLRSERGEATKSTP